METIILVTVLSTLSAVALVTAIVVAFIKLRKKVDVNSFDIEINNIHKQQNDIVDNIMREIDSKNESLYNEITQFKVHIYRDIENNDKNLHIMIDDLRKFIDSRCDKLDGKIKDLKETKVNISKKLLKD